MFSFRKCHNNDSNEAPWKQAVLDQITTGILRILDQLSHENTTQTSSENFDHAKRKLDFDDSAENTKDCSVNVKDLRKHPWWGAKVRQLSSNGEEVICPRILKKNFWDLQKLRTKTYQSVLDFHLDLKMMIEDSSIPKNSEAVKNILESYSQIATETFPWFDIQRPLLHYEPLDTIEVKMPYSDHFYYVPATEKPQTTKKPEVNLKNNTTDVRNCQLCGQFGEKLEGRLLHFRNCEWVHVNCALWSSEVYEEVDGSLQNVGQALSRGAKLNCTVCGKKGATIGCCHEYCKENYHFKCGFEAGAVFKEDKSVYCSLHRKWYIDIGTQMEFGAKRIIHIDVESEMSKKKASKWVDLRNVQINLGSLTIHKLGDEVKNSSDNKEALIPVGFACSRWYWSTLDPTRKVRYYCKTSLKAKEDAKKADLNDVNLTIDHSEISDAEAENSLKNIMKKLRQLESKKEAKKKQKVVFPPYFVNSLWKELNYSDLHRVDPENIGLSPAKKPKLAQNASLNSPISSQKPKTNSNTSSPKSLNKAVSNTLKRTPSKLLDEDLLAAFKNDFPGSSNFLEELLKDQNPDEVQVVSSWFNQKKKFKVTEVMTQCNLPYTRNNFEIDELYEQKHANSEDSMSDVSSSYEDFVEFEQEESLDMLSYVFDKLHEQKSNENLDIEPEKDLENLLEKVVDEENFQQNEEKLDTFEHHKAENEINFDFMINKKVEIDNQNAADENLDIIEQLLQENCDENETPANNNDDQCLSMETSPDKNINITLPDPILEEFIPQFDGADDDKDQDTSPRKDFTIAGLLSPPVQNPQQVSLQNPQQISVQNPQLASVAQNRRPSDDDVVFIATTGPNTATAISQPQFR